MSMYVVRDEIDFAQYMRETVGERKIRDVGDYLQEMIDAIGTPDAVLAGWDLPWNKARGAFRFHPGEVTLWAGANGTGKSLITGMIGMDMVCRREQVVIASLEMPPKKTLARMLRNWVGSDPASYHGRPESEDILRQLMTDFKSVAGGMLKIYDQMGQIESDEALAVVRYSADKLKAKHFILDSLLKCVKGTDDYNKQKDFVNALCAIGKDTGMSIHLVAHTKKLSDEGKRPNKYDVSGTGDITNLVDNALLFWRNKPKEAETRAGGIKLRDEPDAVLMCCKQRELGEEPEIGLWYDKDSQSYVESPGASPIRWDERCI
jgi:twinkle protein